MPTTTVIELALDRDSLVAGLLGTVAGVVTRPRGRPRAPPVDDRQARLLMPWFSHATWLPTTSQSQATRMEPVVCSQPGPGLAMQTSLASWSRFRLLGWGSATGSLSRKRPPRNSFISDTAGFCTTPVCMSLLYRPHPAPLHSSGITSVASACECATVMSGTACDPLRAITQHAHGFPQNVTHGTSDLLLGSPSDRPSRPPSSPTFEFS
jgi:hypothetical protein